ncbi:MAG: hypothetical protein GKR77_05335 [Legionellales bacterium]|nr:hypothetical protein [Legionellales bacterium]
MSDHLLLSFRLILCGIFVFMLAYCTTDNRYGRPPSYTSYTTGYKVKYVPPWRGQNKKRFYPGYYYNAGTGLPYPYIYTPYYWPRFYYRRTAGFYSYAGDRRGFRYYYD